MTEQNAYFCDGPGCDKHVVPHLAGGAKPGDGWIHVVLSLLGYVHSAQGGHFCSLDCALSWFVLDNGMTAAINAATPERTPR